MQGKSGEFGYFWLHRLYLLLGGFVSLAYLVLFLIPYSALFSGPESFNSVITRIHGFPMLGWFATVFVLLPLLFLIALGFMILQSGRLNVITYGSYRNWMYVLQRICGLVLIPFALYHVGSNWLAFAFSGAHITASRLHAIVTPSWALSLYLAGVVAAAFFIGNGLSLAARSLGICASRRSRAAMAIASWVVILAFAAWGVRIVLAM